VTEIAKPSRLTLLESLGDATKFAEKIHSIISFSPLFENFNLAEIKQLGRFMQVYRTRAGIEIIKEGEPGDFMILLIEGKIEVFKQQRWNAAPRLIAAIEQGQTLGEMSMIDGEPRFATCVASDACTIAVLAREALARIVVEQPVLGAKILMELVLMLSRRLRQTSAKLVNYMDVERA
jgi:CRP-like cAMP-binding protein